MWLLIIRHFETRRNSLESFSQSIHRMCGQSRKSGVFLRPKSTYLNVCRQSCSQASSQSATMEMLGHSRGSEAMGMRMEFHDPGFLSWCGGKMGLERRAGKMAFWVKKKIHITEDWCSDTQHPHKCGRGLYSTSNPRVPEVEMRSPGAS